jgi:predicted ribosome-associated RNA-binding protein Tma20
VSSGSTVLEAGVILAEGEERSVKAEDLVLIKNRNGNQIMAVCRGVHATEKKGMRGKFLYTGNIRHL